MIPVGAELAVAQHVEDLLNSEPGHGLLRAWAIARKNDADADEPNVPGAREILAKRELAAWLAHELVTGARDR